MSHRRNDLGQQMISGVDLVIDFATLGEYGLEPDSADGSCRERADRRSQTKSPARLGGARDDPPRRLWNAEPTSDGRRRADWRFPGPASSRADFRAALERYAA